MYQYDTKRIGKLHIYINKLSTRDWSFYTNGQRGHFLTSENNILIIQYQTLYSTVAYQDITIDHQWLSRLVKNALSRL